MDEATFRNTYPTKKEMKKEAEYWLEMMYGVGNGVGCISAEMRYDDDVRVRREWRTIVLQIKSFIKACD